MGFFKIIILIAIFSFMFSLILEIIKRIKKEILHQRSQKIIEENERYRRNEISRYEREFYTSEFTDLIYNKILELSKYKNISVVVYLYKIQVHLPEKKYYAISLSTENEDITFKDIGYNNFCSKEELIAFSNVLTRKFGANYECRYSKDVWNIPQVAIYDRNKMNTPILKNTH